MLSPRGESTVTLEGIEKKLIPEMVDGNDSQVVLPLVEESLLFVTVVVQGYAVGLHL